MNLFNKESDDMTVHTTAQFTEEREEVIMNFLHNQGSIRIGDVTDLLSISPSTARLLLQKMQEKGLLKRTHGGAVLIGREENQKSQNDYTDITHRSEKLKIAAAAAETVSDGDYICLGSGTTTFLMSTLLHGKQDLTVVTDSIPIAYELLHDEGITLYVCGGWIMKRNSACRGLTAENFFKDIRVDKAYNGADSIDIQSGTTSVDFDPRTESAICHSGKECYILTDSSKFAVHPYMDKVLQLKEIDYIVTDDSIDPKYVEALKKENIHVIIGK
jgi:DeoR/GlpR family transcriptional regulator of sugar metabolism